MGDKRWTLKQWKEAVGDSPNWEIFEIPAEVIEKRGLEQDYSIKYVGPIENGTTVEEVPKVPLLYRTFADLKDLIELPLGYERDSIMILLLVAAILILRPMHYRN